MYASNPNLIKLSKLLLELHRQRDFHQLPQQLIETVKALVPADISTYNEIDHISGELRSVHDYRGNAEQYYPAFMKYIHEHPMMGHIRASGTTAAFKTTDFVPQRQFETSPIYNEYFKHLGSRFQIAFFLPKGLRFEVGIALQNNRRDFTENERAILNLFSPHFSLAWQNSLEMTRTKMGNAADEYNRQEEQFKIRLDGRWRIRELPERAGTIVKGFYGFHFKEGQGLPPALIGWLCRQTSTDSKDVLDPATQRSLSSSRAGQTANISWQPESPLKSWLVLTLRSDSWKVVGQANPHLTLREKEVLHWVLAGKTNPEIGMILSLSPNTVRKHLEHSYSKLGVENRAAAMRVLWEMAQSA